MVAFVIIWLASIVAAIALGVRTPRWLIWRLFLFVPLFGEIALFSPLGGFSSNQLPSGVQPLNIWIWVAIVLVYGVILYGPSAIVLGGLGWIVVDKILASFKISNAMLILSVTFVAAAVGGCFWILYDAVVYQRLPSVTSGWLMVSVVGGAAGGFIVGYYASKRIRCPGVETAASSPA